MRWKGTQQRRKQNDAAARRTLHRSVMEWHVALTALYPITPPADKRGVSFGGN
ncbi:MAG: hypothetical protein Fur005_28650 [Roseiflexaceae bacterium]